MSRTAASMLREALENVGVKYTFGIPGVHNTEIYDELAKSSSITPVLVTHEGAGAFMADAVSRSGTTWARSSSCLRRALRTRRAALLRPFSMAFRCS